MGKITFINGSVIEYPETLRVTRGSGVFLWIDKENENDDCSSEKE